MLITDTRDQMRRVAKQVEFVRHLKIGRERLFIEAAIDRIVGQAAIRRTRAVTSAVEPVDQIDHPFEIERVKALDHRRIVRTADALELVGKAELGKAACWAVVCPYV